MQVLQTRRSSIFGSEHCYLHDKNEQDKYLEKLPNQDLPIQVSSQELNPSAEESIQTAVARQNELEIDQDNEITFGDKQYFL